MWPTIKVSPASALALLWFGAACGGRALLAVLCAAAAHECGHLLALRVCGASVKGFRVELSGAVLETDAARLSYGRELLCVLAGPAANLCAALLLARLPWPDLAGANLALCAFNLLPFRPLDGGRAAELCASWLAGPDWGARLSRWSGAAGGVLLLGGAAWLARESGGNLWLLPPAAALSWRAFREPQAGRARRWRSGGRKYRKIPS